MPETSGADVTQLLELWRQGDAASFDAASGLLYHELHRIAQAYLRGAAPNATLQPTALINEAYIRLAQRSCGTFRDRKHFFALAAKIMRQILVDRARERAASKRGGEAVQHVPLDEARDSYTSDPDEFLLLHQALDRLTGYNTSLAGLIESLHRRTHPRGDRRGPRYFRANCQPPPTDGGSVAEPHHLGEVCS